MLIPFIGYALGRRFIGYVECEGERLTDVMNRSESIVVREAFVESFEEDTIVNLGDGEVDRSILYAVESSGARGEGTRGIHTIRHRLQIQLGPYSVLGLLQSLPGQLPLPYLHSRGPMIPLSDATIGFATRGALQLRDVGSLIVNRDMLDWVRASEDEALAFPGVPVLTDRV
ncbi:MAG TPA: hypothetical protein VGE81_09660 [Candidatus Limnocylindrales bacterium]